MKPSEIRSLVLAEHVELRASVMEVESLAARILAGRRQGVRALHTKVKGLAAALQEHIAMEDRLLMPAIREVDAWGPIRAGRMAEEHEAQRAALVRLLDIGSPEGTMEFAQAVQAFGRNLLEDMCREEKELLNPDLLRDDVIAIAQFVG